MSCHAFSLDPRTVLGVSPGASPDEIREAYHAKSKKYHPDAGGDEWAFRMVARAYEVLKTTASAQSSQPWEQPVPGSPAPEEEQRWSWARGPSFSRPDSSAPRWDSTHAAPVDDMGPQSDAVADEEPARASAESAEFRPQPDDLRRVNVELVWTRYEKDALGPFSSTPEADDATLSVCMVISWPPHYLVDRAAEFPSSGETLHTLIELFGQLRTGSVVAARSQIEDGRFVAWLSYPDVPTAGDAVLYVRETLQSRGLSPKLQTRDVVLPLDEEDALADAVPAHSS